MTRRIYYHSSLIAAVAMAFTITPFIADAQDRSQRDRQQRDQQRDQWQRDQGQRDQGQRRQTQRDMGFNMAQISGEIQEMKTVRTRRDDQQHRVARLETDRGTVFADFGPASQKLRNLNLSEGDRIEVQGKMSRMGDRAILLADSVRHDGTKIKVRKPNKIRAEGRVQAVQGVRVKRTGETHRLVLIDTQRGKIAADLGPDARKHNIRPGQHIQIEGRLVRVENKPFLLANSYTVQQGQGREYRETFSRQDQQRQQQRQR